MIAVFADPDAASRALAALGEEGVTRARVASPAPFPVVEQTGHPGPWRILGWVTLVAAFTGLGCAIALEVITSKSMDQIVGGKPVVSWTAFGIVMFEMTMLFAGIATFFTLVVLTAVARRGVSKRARAAVTCDRVVVSIPLDGGNADRRPAISRCIADATEVLP
ncbi:MAG TPA: quinol:electron acceptor oxidoreductase subunit ActD [Kofleriaceae bacterium]|nr:quinol:electron acceptor oxidoreductase subunit ActD [Kofleriaceae bacterium]